MIFPVVKLPPWWAVPVICQFTAAFRSYRLPPKSLPSKKEILPTAKNSTDGKYTAVCCVYRLPTKKCHIMCLPFTAEKYGQLLITPKTYRQHWISPKRYRLHWTPPKKSSFLFRSVLCSFLHFWLFGFLFGRTHLCRRVDRERGALTHLRSNMLASSMVERMNFAGLNRHMVNEVRELDAANALARGWREAG